MTSVLRRLADPSSFAFIGAPLFALYARKDGVVGSRFWNRCSSRIPSLLTGGRLFRAVLPQVEFFVIVYYRDRTLHLSKPGPFRDRRASRPVPGKAVVGCRPLRPLLRQNGPRFPLQKESAGTTVHSLASLGHNAKTLAA